MELIDAEFEDGVFRPACHVALRQGERVGLLVVRRPDPARWDMARLSAPARANDRALAEEGLGDWAATLDGEERK